MRMRRSGHEYSLGSDSDLRHVRIVNSRCAGMNWGKLSYPHVDLTGKTRPLSQGTSGIGFEAAKALVK